MATAGKPAYRERLKALRNRAGLSLEKVSSHLGYNSPAGYHKYERSATQGDKPIPDKIVRRLIPLLRGAGSPPITLEEVMDLSGIEELPGTVRAAYVSSADEHGLLMIHYRIEPGIYIKPGAAQRSLGSARIGASPEYRSERQFAVSVPDTLGKWYPAGSQLHCVDPVEFSAASLAGRKVLVAVPYGTSDLSEVVVAVVSKMAGDKPVLYGADQLPIEGTILGVVVGAYMRQ